MSFRSAFCLILLCGLWGCGAPKPDLNKAKQWPFSPRAAAEGCVAYLEAQCDNSQDSVDHWHTYYLTKAFLTGEKDQVSGYLAMENDTLSFLRDTQYYRNGRIGYRSMYWGLKVKNWDSIQHWSFEDASLGTFIDSTPSPASFTIFHKSFSRSRGFKIYYTPTRSDSVMISINSAILPQKNVWPRTKYTNDTIDRLVTIFRETVPSTGVLDVPPDLLQNISSERLVTVQIAAQNTIISKHFGEWYLLRSTSVANLSDYLVP